MSAHSESDGSVNIRVGSVEYSGTTIYGPLWVEAGDQSFPYADWGDFSVVVLGWWLGELETLASRHARSATLLFMDGPYCIDVERVGDDRVRLWGRKHDGLRDDATAAEVGEASMFLAVVGAARTVLRHCRSAMISSTDVDKLERCIRSMEGQLRELKYIGPWSAS